MAILGILEVLLRGWGQEEALPYLAGFSSADS